MEDRTHEEAREQAAKDWPELDERFKKLLLGNAREAVWQVLGQDDTPTEVLEMLAIDTLAAIDMNIRAKFGERVTKEDMERWMVEESQRLHAMPEHSEGVPDAVLMAALRRRTAREMTNPPCSEDEAADA